MAVEVRQPPAPPESFWDKYGVIVALVSGIIGGVLTLIFSKLLGPIVEDWGQQLKEKLKGKTRRFRERYIAALAEEHRHLRLVGIHGREGIPPPLLKEVYVSLRMGGADEGLEEARTLSIAEAFAHHTHLLILGEPGVGKSTLVDWLTLVFTDQISQPALRRTGNLLPVFLPLRNCVDDDRPLHELMADPALLPVDVQPPEGFFPAEFDRGRCLVLLDGLDEVVDERQRANAARKINELVRTYPDNRYVVTCRTAGWKEGLLTSDFARLYVRDFDDADIARFVSGWYRAVRIREVALRGDLLSAEGQQRATAKAVQEAREEAADLLAALKQNQSLYRLARNPLILSLIALVHLRRTELPKGRAKLYQECLEILLETWDKKDKRLKFTGPSPSLHAKEAILCDVAYYYHSQGLAEAGRDKLESLIAPLLPELDCPTDAAETLRQIEERSGILVSRAIDRYVFAHRTLQEYLVARVLADAPEKADALLTHLDDEPWREVILLYSGLIGERVTALLEDILAQPNDAAHNLLVLAGECLAEDVRVSPETRSKAIKRLAAAFQDATDSLAFERLGRTLATLGGEDVIALFEQVLESGDLPRQKAAVRALGKMGARTGDPGAVAARLCAVLGADAASLRQAAALALADLGRTDKETVTVLKRARQDVVYEVRAAALWALLELGAAEEDMVKIPAGEFLMGSDPRKNKDTRDREQPQHTLYLPDYYIARTPVTNAQFARFVEADGYRRREFWTEVGWKEKEKEGWTQPRYWTKRKWNRPDWPVVGISWYEAMAYARWLGCTLPSEAEWEKAARGTDGRIYPWGNEFDKRRCNTGKVFGGTTPVGKYGPQGNSPYGCMDMAGNTWEWTRSVDKSYPYDPGDGREDLEDRATRVLRGGSFYNDARLARSASRSPLAPYGRDWGYGVRVGVVAAPFSPASAL
jgi:formylglycine-generating enzyme required for sulfatase activity